MGYAKFIPDSWACPAPATLRPEEPLSLVLSYHWQKVTRRLGGRKIMLKESD